MILKIFMENLKSIQKILNYLEDNSEFKNSKDLESLFLDYLDYENLIEYQREIQCFIQVEFTAYYLNLLKNMNYIRFLQSNTYFFYFVLNLTTVIGKK